MPFVEALTQLRHKCGKGNFVNIQVSYVPIINGEQKTKPTQHAVKSIRSAGLIPDLVRAVKAPTERVSIVPNALDRLLVVANVPWSKAPSTRSPFTARSSLSR